MKKVVMVALSGMVLLVSCTKSRTCTCVYSNGSQGYTEHYTTTKGDAKAQCDDQNGAGKLCTLD